MKAKWERVLVGCKQITETNTEVSCTAELSKAPAVKNSKYTWQQIQFPAHCAELLVSHPTGTLVLNLHLLQVERPAGVQWTVQKGLQQRAIAALIEGGGRSHNGDTCRVGPKLEYVASCSCFHRTYATDVAKALVQASPHALPIRKQLEQFLWNVAIVIGLAWHKKYPRWKHRSSDTFSTARTQFTRHPVAWEHGTVQ